MELEEEMELPLPDFKTLIAKLVPIDLSNWNIDTYYEAMGLDFEETVDVVNENDHQ